LTFNIEWSLPWQVKQLIHVTRAQHLTKSIHVLDCTT